MPALNTNITKDLIKDELSKRYFDHFYTKFNPTYSMEWFHQRICEKLEQKDWKRLMIFLPPQHGKSMIVSATFPSWYLGQNPDERVAIVSYSATKASQFNRANQRIMDSKEYHAIFPETKIPAAKAYASKTDAYARTNYEVEIVDKLGGLISTGIGGPLTGNRVDLAIIDDPIKDDAQANSQVYREKVWEWYTSVLETRLHNDSRVVLMMTRWHEDDLAGRLLAKMKEEEGEEWEVISIPAIREDDTDEADPREIDEALWEKRHSREKIMKQRSKSEKVYNALYQQRPSSKKGNIFKRDWFIKCDYMYMVERALRANTELTPIFTLDTAYTEDQKNDPSGILGCYKIENDLFIFNYKNVNMDFPDLIEFVPEWVKKNNYARKSRIYVEPKASGKSVKQTLKKKTKLNIIEYMPYPDLDKVGRAHMVSPEAEAGRVYLVKGPWVENFLESVSTFPLAPHDEEVDCLIMAIAKLLISEDSKSSYRSF